jgi:hypothetical protein
MNGIRGKPPQKAGRAAYGLRLSGLDDVTELEGPPDAGTDLIPVQVNRVDGPPPELHELDHERTVRALPEDRHLHLERAAGRATFFGPPLPPDELAHPYLGPVAVTFNRWAGREVFHAGAFVHDGHAFVLLGPRTAGKSTLVAALAQQRLPILADDIVVIDGGIVYSGPRSVDLREAIPEHVLGNTLSTAQPSRLGTRSRIVLPATATRWPLGGWIFLNWHDHSPTMRPVPLPELLGRLAGRRLMPGLPSDPARILSLSAVPAWDFGRRKSWGDLSSSLETLLTAVHLRSMQDPAERAVGVR